MKNKYFKKKEPVATAIITSYVATNERFTTVVRTNDQTPGHFDCHHEPGELQARGYEEISQEEFDTVFWGFTLALHEQLQTGLPEWAAGELNKKEALS